MTENILTLGDLLLGVHENMGSGYSYAAVDLYAQLQFKNPLIHGDKLGSELHDTQDSTFLRITCNNLN